jgi:hypothetical protein
MAPEKIAGVQDDAMATSSPHRKHDGTPAKVERQAKYRYRSFMKRDEKGDGVLP